MERIAPVAASLCIGILSYLLLPEDASPRTEFDPFPRIRSMIERCSQSKWMPDLGSIAPIRRVLEWIDAPLVDVGMPLTMQGRGFILLLCCAGSSIAGAFAAQSSIGFIIGFFAFSVGTVSAGNALELASRIALKHEMPQLIRMLGSALASGKTLAQAIAYVGSRGTGAAAREFRRTSLAIRCGVSVGDALDDLSSRLDAPGMELVVSALSISQRTGSPLENLLLRSADMVEGAIGLERKLEVKTAQARLSARIVCLLPLIMCALLAMISPDFQRDCPPLQAFFPSALQSSWMHWRSSSSNV